MRGEDGKVEVRTWPRHSPVPLERPISATCGACRAPWLIHRALAGFRMRCDCGAWIDVPADRPLDLAAGRQTLLIPQQAGSYVRRPRQAFDPVLPSPMPTDPVAEAASTLTTATPLATDGLVAATPETRRRWIDRSLLELVAILLAFGGPALAIHLAVSGPGQALLLPFAGVASGVLVLLIGLGSAHYAFGGLRRASALAFLEATGVALGLALLAVGWVSWLERAGFAGDWLGEVVAQLGLPLSLFTIALLPAIFEELAFRGLVQGRAMALLGRTGGILVAGLAFALAHGVTLGLPFHVGLGLYLGWLRVRTDSVVPGMVTHGLYNGILVLVAAQPGSA